MCERRGCRGQKGAPQGKGACRGGGGGSEAPPNSGQTDHTVQRSPFIKLIQQLIGILRASLWVSAVRGGSEVRSAACTMSWSLHYPKHVAPVDPLARGSFAPRPPPDIHRPAFECGHRSAARRTISPRGRRTTVGPYGCSYRCRLSGNDSCHSHFTGS